MKTFAQQVSHKLLRGERGTLRYAASLALSCVTALNGFAQVPAIPAWMQASFAEGTTTALPEATRGSVKHNTFIGSYTARLTIRTPEGIRQQLFLSAWQDSTRGIMQLEAEYQNDHQHLKMRVLELKPGAVDPKMFEITKESWKP